MSLFAPPLPSEQILLNLEEGGGGGGGQGRGGGGGAGEGIRNRQNVLQHIYVMSPSAFPDKGWDTSNNLFLFLEKPLCYFF